MSTKTTDHDQQKNKLYLTNNYSIVSKYSASKFNYFKDDILETFIENCSTANIDPRRRRTPLVNRGYAARSLAFEWAVSRAIKNDHINCFIVLGSGFDMLAQRHLGECYWIEIDLPEVIETKSKFIESHWNLTREKECDLNSDEIIRFPSLHLILISCDLFHTRKLSDLLNGVLLPIRLDCKRVAITNEVCLCYSDPQQVTQILRTIIESVEDFCWQLYYIGYEQVKFDDMGQFGSIMTDHFASLGHPLKYFPHQNEIKQMFMNELKFHHVTVSSMFQIYHNALQAETVARNTNRLEPFDEYEDMDLYLGHYALVTGVIVFKSPFSLEMLEDGPEEECINDQLEAPRLSGFNDLSIQDCPVQRFGHAVCALTDSVDSQEILVVGGFGIDTMDKQEAQHKRLNRCVVMSRKMCDNGWNLFNLDTIIPSDKYVRLDRVHAQVCHLGDNLVFVHGGRQSPTKQSTISSNNAFVCRIDLEAGALKVKHMFNSESRFIDWRHRLIYMDDHRIIKAGGLGADDWKQDCMELFNFEADKLGSQHFYMDDSSDAQTCFKRHSFGADQRDRNTFLLFGGLQADHNYRDKPVDSNHNIVLCDLRAILNHEQSCQLKAGNPDRGSYNCHIHFINDNQFVKLAGISTKTGLSENSLDIYDLRSHLICPVESKLMPIYANRSEPLIWTNSTSCHFSSRKQIQVLGGGGNYFTFGTHFNKSQITYQY